MSKHEFAVSLALGVTASVAIVVSAASNDGHSLDPYDARAATPSSVPTQACGGSIDGVEYPHLVPAHLAWSSVFEQVRKAGDQHITLGRDSLGVAAFDFMHRRLDELDAATRAINADPAVPPQARETIIADAILDARDDLLRVFSDEAGNALVREAARSRKRPFALAPPGRRTGTDSCQVSVRGRAFPHLIPENLYWRFYFLQRAATGSRFKVANGYAAEHIQAVRRTLPVSPEELTLIIDVATKVTADIQRISAGPTATDTYEELIASARMKLLKGLSKDAWVAVTADARRSRMSARIVFPVR